MFNSTQLKAENKILRNLLQWYATKDLYKSKIIADIDFQNDKAATIQAKLNASQLEQYQVARNNVDVTLVALRNKCEELRND